MVEFAVVFKCAEVNKFPEVEKKPVDGNIDILLARFYVDSANKTNPLILNN